jgi:hypothetical protein
VQFIRLPEQFSHGLVHGLHTVPYKRYLAMQEVQAVDEIQFIQGLTHYKHVFGVDEVLK